MATSPPIHERIGDYVVRQGTLDDLEAIVNIDDDLFGGIDYMSAMYYLFLQSERDLVLIIEENGKPISVSVNGFYETDPTAVVRLGGRICREKRGQGVFHHLSIALRNFLLRRYPELTHRVAMTEERHKKPGSYECLYRTNVLRCDTTVGQIRDKLSRYRPTHHGKAVPIRRLTHQEVVELLYNGNSLEEFIGQYCSEYALWLIGNWRPVKLNVKSDLKKLFTTSAHVLITTESDSSPQTGLGDTGTRQVGRGGKITSLSYSFALPVKHGFSYQTVFLGADPTLAALHEIEHGRHLTNIGNGDVIMIFMIPHGMDVDLITERVDDVIGKHVKFSESPWIIIKQTLL